MQRGILGGTFDPIHIAHLIAGEGAYRQLHLDVVTFIPAGSPWQKAGRRLSAPAHRLAMARLAVQGVEYFEVDDREVDREGPTFTVETLASFPDDEKLTLILGADAASRFNTWQQPEAVASRADIAVVPRPGTHRQAVEAGIGRPVHWIDLPAIEVSGSDIRRRAADGRGIRFLVPEVVFEYIIEHEPYAD